MAALKNFNFLEDNGAYKVAYEPIGVVGMITPWNWPLNQIALKVAPAIAAGNTMILKPSEECPTNAAIFAEILDAAGVPAGVFNLIQGDGPGVGTAISSHPGIDMVSFTGSTRAGILVAKAAADTVKRVHQELGGKSPNVVLPDADFAAHLPSTASGPLVNSGQSCISPTRILVPRERADEAAAFVSAMYSATTVGDPMEEGAHIGPVVNKTQFDKIRGLIQSAIDEGAKLETGGPDLPANVNRGYYIKPTVFSGVTPICGLRRKKSLAPSPRSWPMTALIRPSKLPTTLLTVCPPASPAIRPRPLQWPRTSRWHGSHQQLGPQPRRAVWRLQAIGQWP
jgi:aldehyde dehydrogenase (NAD+)